MKCKELTNEEMGFCEDYLDLITQIVITAACSSINPLYLEGLQEINKKYNFTKCITCNSSIFLATNSLYKCYLYTKEIKDNELKKKGKRNGKSKITNESEKCSREGN